MFKPKFGKRTSLNIGGSLLFAAALFLISYALLRENVLPISIDSIMGHLNHSVRHWHVLVIGLLPVYVAIFIFGTAIVILYLSSILYNWFAGIFRK